MDIVLYYAPNTCALVPFVALTEAGAPFRVEALNFRRKEQMSPDFLRLNPKHKVPLLLVDGKGLTENSAMHVWIARAFPKARLMPEDPWLFVQAISVASWCSSGIHPNLSLLNTPSKCCDAPGSEESVRRLARAALDENFAIADQMLAGREFLFDQLLHRRRASLLVPAARVSARLRHRALAQLQGLLRTHIGARERAESLRVREGDARAVRGVRLLT